MRVFLEHIIEKNSIYVKFSHMTPQLDTHCRLKVVQFLHKEYSVNIAVDYVSITAILHNFDLQ